MCSLLLSDTFALYLSPTRYKLPSAGDAAPWTHEGLTLFTTGLDSVTLLHMAGYLACDWCDPDLCHRSAIGSAILFGDFAY
jgi:hypothetical protein